MMCTTVCCAKLKSKIKSENSVTDEEVEDAVSKVKHLLGQDDENGVESICSLNAIQFIAQRKPLWQILFNSVFAGLCATGVVWCFNPARNINW